MGAEQSRLKDSNIHSAVELWCTDRKSAEARYGCIEEWDTAGVTNMSRLFENRSDFNDDISKWNVSKVTDMSHMFHGANSFNQTLGNWNMSKVASMKGMFNRASSFNQDIGMLPK